MTWLSTLLPGLLVGIALQRIGFASLCTVRRTFALRTPAARVLPAALGFGMLLCALLCWLAVIDTDLLPVLPLHGNVLTGGVIAGIALGLTGCTPGACLAALGGGRFLPALCGLLGILSGTALFLLAGNVFSFAKALLPESYATLFRVTLTQPFAVDGRFLGLGCLGLFIVALTLLFPQQGAAHSPAPQHNEPAVPPATAPDDVHQEAFISLLPEEEPLVVDTVAADDSSPADPPPSDLPAADHAPLPDESPPDEDTSSVLPPDTHDQAATLLPTEHANTHFTPGAVPSVSDDSAHSSANNSDEEDATMSSIRPADPVTPGMTPAPASADPETGVSPVPVVLPARKVHHRKPTGTRKRKN